MSKQEGCLCKRVKPAMNLWLPSQPGLVGLLSSQAELSNRGLGTWWDCSLGELV